ncbi:MAG: anti-sigma factor antagonist [Candidatus Sumerlaeaceae bacterium]
MITGASAEHQIFYTESEVYIAFKGRIVLEDCERLRSASIAAVSRGGVERVYVDLSQVEYIDSAGLGLLVGLKMTAKKSSARIILLAPSRTVADILYISKLEGIFEILSGAEASAVKSRLALAGNAPKSASSSNRSSDFPSRFDTAYPEIGSSGNTTPSGSMSGREGVETHCRRAVEFMRQGNYEMAVEEYRGALALDPEYLPALNNLAIVYEKQPSWNAQAIQQWEKVLSLSRQRGDQKHQDRATRHLANLRSMHA